MNEVTVFYILAAVIVISALLVVTLRNIVHSALYMILTFIGVAGIYIMLDADFLASVQILVYAGAIAVFIVFGIMLTQRGNMKQTNLFSKQAGMAGIVSLAMLALIVFITNKTDWAPAASGTVDNTVATIADKMMSTYAIPFEIAAILLTVAMLGAIIIAKGVNKSQ